MDSPSPVPARGDHHDSDGRYVRQDYTIRGRITADESSGYRAEAGRYHLYASYACPWAQRALIVRELLGLWEVT